MTLGWLTEWRRRPHVGVGGPQRGVFHVQVILPFLVAPPPDLRAAKPGQPLSMAGLKLVLSYPTPCCSLAPAWKQT